MPASNGGVWFYLPAMIVFFVTLTEIVSEKELRLRLGAFVGSGPPCAARL